ncbi:MAG: NAD(P)-dependent alcohol dehydrogenase, partial [Defluviitaleaceae bacterium]|nr:NAD(P)-dependent alcohol dehydrogenase [Defluviitaleaceae bacterium]
EHNLQIKEMPMPEPKEGQVLIKMAANGICGSDIHFYVDGKLGHKHVTTPYVPGHEASGTVVGVGKGCKHLKEGTRVAIEPGTPCGFCEFCKAGRYNMCRDMHFLSSPPINGTLCDYIALPEHLAFPIPDTLSLEDASLAEPAAVGIHAVNQVKGSLLGMTGVIVGAGPIGLMTLQAFKAAGGGKVYCVDYIDKRLEAAKVLGADVACKPGDPMLKNVGDAVFECAGSTEATQGLIEKTKRGGSIVQVGWPEDIKVALDVASILDREITYTGIYRYANCYPPAVTRLGDGRLKSEGVITHRFSFEEGAKAFEWAANNKETSVKTVILND